MWLAWLFLLYEVAASSFVGAFMSIEQTPGNVGMYVGMGVAGALLGLGAYLLRRHLYWVTRRLDFRSGWGVIAFILLTLAVLFFGNLGLAGPFVGVMLYGDRTWTLLSTANGLLALFTAFPLLPRKEPVASLEE